MVLSEMTVELSDKAVDISITLESVYIVSDIKFDCMGSDVSDNIIKFISDTIDKAICNQYTIGNLLPSTYHTHKKRIYREIVENMKFSILYNINTDRCLGVVEQHSITPNTSRFKVLR